MIAVDTNILVYAHRSEMSQHARALTVLRDLAEGAQPWGLPVVVLGEFLRVVTHPRMFDPPSPRVLHPAGRFWELLAEAVEDADASGNPIDTERLMDEVRDEFGT